MNEKTMDNFNAICGYCGRLKENCICGSTVNYEFETYFLKSIE